MIRRNSLKYTLAATLAAGAVAASPALAEPIDTSANRADSPTGSLAGTTEQNLKKQDLRGEFAKDTAVPGGQGREARARAAGLPDLPRPAAAPQREHVRARDQRRRQRHRCLAARPQRSGRRRARRRRSRRHHPPHAPARAPRGRLTNTPVGAPAAMPAPRTTPSRERKRRDPPAHPLAARAPPARARQPVDRGRAAPPRAPLVRRSASSSTGDRRRRRASPGSDAADDRAVHRAELRRPSQPGVTLSIVYPSG